MNKKRAELMFRSNTKIDILLTLMQTHRHTHTNYFFSYDPLYSRGNKNLPVDICVVILVVVDVLCRDANKSGIAMANSKLAVRIPNIRP